MDGAPTMVGGRCTIYHRSSEKKVSKEKGKTIKLHWIVHQEVLRTRNLKYNYIMMKAINCICSGAMCHCQFQNVLPVLNTHADYGEVVYHIDIRWLSWGSALQRFHSLRKEFIQFFTIMTADPGLFDAVWLVDFRIFSWHNTTFPTCGTQTFRGKNAVVS